MHLPKRKNEPDRFRMSRDWPNSSFEILVVLVSLLRLVLWRSAQARKLKMWGIPGGIGLAFIAFPKIISSLGAGG